MHIRIIVAGKPGLAYAKSGVEEYLKRLSREAVELISVKAGSSDEVSARLLEKSAGSFRIVLDERGKNFTTRELAARLDSLAQRGDIKAISFLIGAADGHNEHLRSHADLLLAISPFTLMHELALLVLLEQIYRISTLKSGSPYHRD